MTKTKITVIGTALILSVFVTAGGFTVERILSPSEKDKLIIQESLMAQESAIMQESTDELTAMYLETAEMRKSDTKLLDKQDDQNEDEEFKIVKYVVKSGDTLESIAKTHNVQVSTIEMANSMSRNSILSIGKKLEFPSIDGALYKVRKGETLWDLASTYDVETGYIVAINNIDSPDKLKVGQQILLPGVEKLKEEKPAPKPKSSSPRSNIKVASRGSTSTKTSSSKGGWPVKGTVTSKFGPRWDTQHKGIDIAAPIGTNVYAYLGGRVIYSRWNGGGYGYLVKIDHGNGLSTYYAHNSKLLVKEGQTVKKGQHIAEVGSTGYSTGPHLHFEVRKNGTPVNPYNYLK